MDSLANSEDPDEMLNDVAFHLDLLCLRRQNRSLEQELQYCVNCRTLGSALLSLCESVHLSITS